MRKLIFFLCIALTTLSLLFISCEELSGDSSNYRKACEEHDFNKAWGIVSELKEQYDKAYADYYGDGIFSSESNKNETEKKYSDAFDYVLRSEVNYLLANGDETSAKRIMILLNEQKLDDYKKNSYIKEFTKLAITLDNDYVVELFAKNATLEDEELLSYLIHKNTTESSDKVLSIISHEFNKCEKPAPGLNEYHLVEDNSSLAHLFGVEKTTAYKHFNSHLNSILNLAISNHNRYLAEKILGLYVQTLAVIRRGSGERYKGVVLDGNHSYVEFNNSEKDEAQRIFKDAVKSGVFND